MNIVICRCFIDIFCIEANVLEVDKNSRSRAPLCKTSEAGVAVWEKNRSEFKTRRLCFPLHSFCPCFDCPPRREIVHFPPKSWGSSRRAPYSQPPEQALARTLSIFIVNFFTPFLQKILIPNLTLSYPSTNCLLSPNDR